MDVHDFSHLETVRYQTFSTSSLRPTQLGERVYEKFAIFVGSSRCYTIRVHSLQNAAFEKLLISEEMVRINPLKPNVTTWLHDFERSAPYRSNPPFLIFDIRTLWRSGLSARVPECQKLKMVG